MEPALRYSSIKKYNFFQRKHKKLLVLIGISLIGLFQFGTVTYATDTNTVTMQRTENNEQISENVVDFDFFKKVKDKVSEKKYLRTEIRFRLR